MALNPFADAYAIVRGDFLSIQLATDKALDVLNGSAYANAQPDRRRVIQVASDQVEGILRLFDESGVYVRILGF